MKPVIAIVCTTDSMISSFLLPYISAFESKGYEVQCFCSRTGKYYDVLCEKGVKLTELPFTRNPFTLDNVRALRILNNVLKDRNVKMVFCHEPVGGVMGRLAAWKNRIPSTYMVHGFHFFRGAPIINWVIYYPIEKIMSYITDVLFTINCEDYEFAKKHMKARQIEYLPGVGIDINKYDSVSYDRNQKRKELDISEDSLVLISVGELNTNKNHIAILEAINLMKNEVKKKICYVIAGVGDCETRLKLVAERYGISLLLLGYRNDCEELYAASDIFCFPSYREGLSVALMEAMAAGLPVMASKIRGNVDLIDEDGGILVNPDNYHEMSNALERICLSDDTRISYGSHNKKRIQEFGISRVLPRFMAFWDNCTEE